MKAISFLMGVGAILFITFELSTPFQRQSESKPQSIHSTMPANRNCSDSCCIMTSGNSHQAKAKSALLPGNSIYQLGSNWKNQEGRTLNISDLQGKIEIIAMFYSHCTYACPLTINDMKKIQSGLPKNVDAKTGFVLVSFDPERDKPQVLKTLASDQQLNEREWTLLTGTGDDARSLAAALGVEFKKKSNGDFLHSSQITVLDKDGEIIYKHLGLNQPIDDVVRTIERYLEQD